MTFPDCRPAAHGGLHLYIDAAVPLLAAAITRDPMPVAGITIAAELPSLLVRCAIAALLAVVGFTDATHMVLLVAFVLALGVCEVLFDVAAPTILPRIVGKDQLPRANARLSAVELSTNEFLGPPLGGVLFRLAPGVPFVLDALSFAVSAAALQRIRGALRAEHAGEHTGKHAGEQGGTGVRRMLRDIAEGGRWLRHQPLLIGMTAVVTFMNLARAMTLAVFVLYALEPLRLGAIGFAVLSSAVAVGAVAATFVADRRGWRHVGPIMPASAIGHGATTAAMGLTSNPWVAGAASAGCGFATMTWNVLSSSVRQTVVPDRLLGRVGSVNRFVSRGSLPIGGLFADWHGLPAPFFAGGLVVVVAALAASRLLLGIGALLKEQQERNSKTGGRWPKAY
ncbi:MFS transporter [Dactylosporangium sp. NPDC049525]|uniref:MFS transporter n=1 Tax=Dactylosporangium sp. NPDC049525 TaxID=3154730 RepID=UPI003434BA84